MACIIAKEGRLNTHRWLIISKKPGKKNHKFLFFHFAYGSVEVKGYTVAAGNNGVLGISGKAAPARNERGCKTTPAAPNHWADVRKNHAMECPETPAAEGSGAGTAVAAPKRHQTTGEPRASRAPLDNSTLTLPPYNKTNAGRASTTGKSRNQTHTR
jgi:hypothetical protein